MRTASSICTWWTLSLNGRKAIEQAPSACQPEGPWRSVRNRAREGLMTADAASPGIRPKPRCAHPSVQNPRKPALIAGFPGILRCLFPCFGLHAFCKRFARRSSAAAGDASAALCFPFISLLLRRHFGIRPDPSAIEPPQHFPVHMRHSVDLQQRKRDSDQEHDDPAGEGRSA